MWVLFAIFLWLFNFYNVKKRIAVISQTLLSTIHPLSKLNCKNYYISAMVQLYGQCHGNDTLHLVGDKSKYRKPGPRPRPERCFCYGRCGGREVCQNMKEREQCQVTHYPNLFDHNSQLCRRGDHDHCKSKDINMICGDKKMMDWRDRQEKNVCECRQGMQFDTK